MDADDPLVQECHARLGKTLSDKWRLDALIGVGSLSSVYAASHRDGTFGAIKLLHPNIAAVTEVRARFLRDAYVANKVGHPATVTVLADDVDPKLGPYLVMELLVGTTVATNAAAAEGRLPLQEVLLIADQTLAALEAAHKNGIVHGDIRPENLFLTRKGVLKLLDFGLGRLLEESGAKPQIKTSRSGAPGFLSPEHALQRWSDVDSRTDLWTVGATMFTLLTGLGVHEGANESEMLVAAATRPARSIARIDPDAPAMLVRLMDRALDFDRTKRYPDASAMRFDIGKVMQVVGVFKSDRSPDSRLPPSSAHRATPTGDPRPQRNTPVSGHVAPASSTRRDFESTAPPSSRLRLPREEEPEPTPRRSIPSSEVEPSSRRAGADPFTRKPPPPPTTEAARRAAQATAPDPAARRAAQLADAEPGSRRAPPSDLGSRWPASAPAPEPAARRASVAAPEPPSRRAGARTEPEPNTRRGHALLSQEPPSTRAEPDSRRFDPRQDPLDDEPPSRSDLREPRARPRQDSPVARAEGRDERSLRPDPRQDARQDAPQAHPPTGRPRALPPLPREPLPDIDSDDESPSSLRGAQIPQSPLLRRQAPVTPTKPAPPPAPATGRPRPLAAPPPNEVTAPPTRRPPQPEAFAPPTRRPPQPEAVAPPPMSDGPLLPAFSDDEFPDLEAPRSHRISRPPQSTPAPASVRSLEAAPTERPPSSRNEHLLPPLPPLAPAHDGARMRASDDDGPPSSPRFPDAWSDVGDVGRTAPPRPAVPQQGGVRTHVARTLDARVTARASDDEIRAMKDLFGHLGNAVLVRAQHGVGHADTVRRFDRAYKSALSALAHAPEGLLWNVTPYSFECGAHTVWEPEAPVDEVPYRLFAAGVRTMAVFPGVEEVEFKALLRILTLDAATEIPLEDDLATLLWDAGFQHISFRALDFYASGDQKTRAQLERDRQPILELAMHDTSAALEAAWRGRASLPGVSGAAPYQDAVVRFLLSQPLAATGKTAALTPATADALRMDDVSKAVLVARMDVDVATTNERFALAIVEAYQEASLRSAAAQVTTPVRTAIDALALNAPGAAIQLVSSLCAAIGDPGLAKVEKLRRAILNSVVSNETLKHLIAGVARRPDAEDFVRRTSTILASLDTAYLPTVLSCLAVTRDRSIRELMLGFVGRLAVGQEATIGSVLTKVDEELGLGLLRILAPIPGAAARDAILWATHSPYPVVRIEALGHVEGLSSERLRLELRALIEDPDPNVRIAALRAMVKYAIKAAGPYMVLRIRSVEFDELPMPERRQALAALSALMPPRAETVCMELLSDTHLIPAQAHEETRELAAEVLGKLGSSRDALACLTEAATKRWRSSERVRAAAAKAIEQFGARTAGRSQAPGGGVP